MIVHVSVTGRVELTSTEMRSVMTDLESSKQSLTRELRIRQSSTSFITDALNLIEQTIDELGFLSHL